jgi:hypothetical protein
MSDETPEQGITDDQLPEDLQRGEDNPLAEPLAPGETPDVGLNEPSRSYARESASESDAGRDAGDGDGGGDSDSDS